MTDALRRAQDDRRKSEARTVRQAILSLSDEPVIGDAIASLGWRATDDQLINLARRIR